MNRTEDEKNLDDLFAFSEEDMGQTAALLKKTKRQSSVRVALISGFVAILILALGGILKIQITPSLVSHQIIEQEYFHSLYGANNYLADWEEEYRLIASTGETTMYKLVEGIPVYWKTIGLQRTVVTNGIQGGISDDWLENQYSPVYSLNGQKMMQFFAPGVNYASYSDDFYRLDGMGAEKVVEMGLSLDRDYTLGEIEALLPEGVHLTWSWLNTYQEGELVVDGKGLVLLGDEILGFPSLDELGMPYANPIDQLKMTLEMGMDASKKHRDEFSTVYARLGGDGLNESSVPIIGVVVTGTPEAIMGLVGQSWIKSASLGAVTDKY